MQATAWYLGLDLWIVDCESKENIPFIQISGNIEDPEIPCAGPIMTLGTKSNVHFQSLLPTEMLHLEFNRIVTEITARSEKDKQSNTNQGHSGILSAKEVYQQDNPIEQECNRNTETSQVDHNIANDMEPTNDDIADVYEEENLLEDASVSLSTDKCNEQQPHEEVHSIDHTPEKPFVASGCKFLLDWASRPRNWFSGFYTENGVHKRGKCTLLL